MISKETYEKIRQLIDGGCFTFAEMARRAGVSVTTVRRIENKTKQESGACKKTPRIVPPNRKEPASWCETCQKRVYKPCLVCQLRKFGMTASSGDRLLDSVDLVVREDDYARYVDVMRSMMLVDEFRRAIEQKPPDSEKQGLVEAEIRKRLCFGEATWRKAAEQARENAKIPLESPPPAARQ